MKLEAKQRLLAAGLKPVNWRRPTSKELAFEYKVEYALPQRRWDQRAKSIGAPYPIFTSEGDFIAKMGQAIEYHIPIQAFHTVNNLTLCRSIRELKDLVGSYSFPRDVYSLIRGFESGAKMPLPIVVGGSKGSWILGGNTRLNVAAILGYETKTLLYTATP